MYRTCGQWYAFHIWVVGFSIVIGLDILDIWSVLCSTCGCRAWYGDRTGHTGHIVSVLSFTCDGWI